MSFRYLLSVACMALIFLACTEDEKDGIIETNSYLPLRVGNYWDYEVVTYKSSYIRREYVRTTIKRNGDRYYEVVGGPLAVSASIHYDTAYYHIDNNGYVYCWRAGWENEENLYRLFASHGDQWSFKSNFGDRATVESFYTTVEIGEKEIPECKGYFYDVPMIVDEENTGYLAPGIGCVGTTSMWQVKVLKKAFVNGIEYTF
jgi:hypothetical protein